MRRRCLFLDRDGVINVDHIFVHKASAFDFIPGIFPFLRSVQNNGYRLVVVTNQSGVGQGLFSEQDYLTLNDHMCACFNREGITIDLTLACYVQPEKGISPEFARQSFWRKPNPGMILEAAQRLRLDLNASALIGDQPRDVQAAAAAGVPTRLWLTEKEEAPPAGAHKVRTYDEALAYLI